MKNGIDLFWKIYGVLYFAIGLYGLYKSVIKKEEKHRMLKVTIYLLCSLPLIRLFFFE